jgi:hypothetical protein
VDEAWHWEFGDGASSEGPRGRHTFAHPGRYWVTARRGERVLGAQIDVEEPAPPEVLRVLARSRDVRIVFDEPIASEGGRARFGSGTPIEQVFVERDRHTLHVRTQHPVPASDLLHLEGVRDRAAVANTMSARTLAIERGEWPSRRDGLVYLFETGAQENRVTDPRTGQERSYALEARGRARYDHDRALQLAGGYFEAREVARVVGEACARSGEFTIEALIRPDQIRVGGKPLVVSLEREGGRWLFYLSHEGDRLRVRLLTDTDPTVGVAHLESEDPLHLVVSYRDGRLVSFRNGSKVLDTDRVRGDLSRWSEARNLVFGDVSDGGQDWRGKLEGLAFYSRSMDAEEASANAQAYLERIAERESVPRVRVRARLVHRSDLPTLEQIVPYREALVLYEYEVIEVIEGELGAERLRVAHWAILDGNTQGVGSRRPGSTHELMVEPLDRNQQVASLYLSDTLDLDAEAALFLDVSP